VPPDRGDEPFVDVPSAPSVVAATWPAAADGLAAYCRLLALDGVTRGLVGPREVPRLWDRHLLNCAVIESEVPPASSVADVGSGAGLPGLVLALVRPDLRITLIEPLARRCDFLHEAVATLGLADRVEVLRGRAESQAGSTGYDVVTARAVAPLERLAGWCLPLVRRGGRLVAMKGSKADQELADAADVLRRFDVIEARVDRCGVGIVAPPTTVVVAVRAAEPRG
jgi:16S rRNA (guanine527-N7)-methyltransferase